METRGGVSNTVSMHPQQHLQNSGMIALGPFRKQVLESFLDSKSGMHLYKNLYAGLHNHLGIHWNLRMVFQLMM
jgi:hypothetical protein